MTQEDKRLLIRDLCSRLPYWPDVITSDGDKGYITGVDDTEEGIFFVHILEDGDDYECPMSVEQFLPKLRPMKSITEEEAEEFEKVSDNLLKNADNTKIWTTVVNWLLEHGFDCNGLIEKKLATEKYNLLEI